MVHVICDICKKHIPGAITSFSWERKELNYHTVLDKAICYTCMNKLDEEVRENMNAKSEFGFLDRNRIYKSTLEKMCK